MSRPFGAYVLMQELARGGQGSVWRARHEATGQEVALKLLVAGGESATLRFAQEARVLGKLSHPNVVAVFDHGVTEGTPFIACELVAGDDLAARAKGSAGLPPPGWTAQVLIAVARALQHCHERGIVHRDVKPANIIVERVGDRPVLVDFGLVKRDPAQLGITSIDDRGELSLSGSLKGTPEFMAPEQIHPKHGEIGPPTDVYGLGATLYYLLTGQAPFSAESMPVLLRKVTRQAPPDPTQLNPAVPAALARLCLHALQKDPRARPPTAEAFAHSLQASNLITSAPGAGGPSRTSSGRLAALLGGLQGPAKPGQRVGPYTVVRELGRGAMGVVFEGRGDDGREVAVKLLTSLGADERVKKRFQREVKALSALDHPHVVRFAGASTEGTPWLAMELVRGRDLQARLEQDGAPDFDDTARLVEQIARGVAHAHEREVMHRDLKPSNVLVRDDDGGAVVTDFGLARSLEASKFTRTGDTVGTLAYMAPEQIRGQREEGPPADVWAIGAILFRCLTGEPPFSSESALGLAGMIAEGNVRRPSAIDKRIPRDLESVCLACLRRDPLARPTAAQVARALKTRTQLGGARRLDQRLVLGSLASIAVVVVGAAGLLVTLGRAPGGDGVASAGSRTTTTADAPAAASAVPWPAAGAPWRVTWALGRAKDPPPAVAAPALWEDEGRIAAPLASVLSGRPEALTAAFLGDATLEEGRVVVRYREPARALRFEATTPAHYMIITTPMSGDETVSFKDGAALVRIDDDAGGATVWVGAARWEQTRVSLAASRYAPVDLDEVVLRLGSGPTCALKLHGRTMQAFVSPWTVVPPVKFTLSGGPLQVGFGPDARDGREVLRLDDATWPRLESAVRPGPGPVRLQLLEAFYAFERLEVSGRPVRTDTPAIALAPPELPTTARVLATFRREAASGASGGPFVGLADAGGLSVQLELDGALLVLRRRGLTIASAPVTAPPAEGWLELARLGDTITGTLHPASGAPGASVQVSVACPLPLGGPLRAAWGSGAERVAFDAVEVQGGKDDIVRRGWDAKPLETDGSAREAWRTGALLCARVTDPTQASRELLGGAGRNARRAAAERAAAMLGTAAERLAAAQGDDREALIADALARAVLARVVAADATGAASAARALVSAAGKERAGATLDALERDLEGRPILLARLAQGYGSVLDIQVQEASLRCLLEVSAAHEALALTTLAGTVRNRKPAPDPSTADGRAALEGALTQLARARAAVGRATRDAADADRDDLIFGAMHQDDLLPGIPTRAALLERIDGYEADTLMDLGRWQEACDGWDRVIAARPTYWWAWRRRSQSFEQRAKPGEALESLLGAIACAPARTDMWTDVVELSSALTRERQNVGLAAAALLLAADGLMRPSLEEQGTRLAELASKLPPASPRDADLLAYVRARMRQTAQTASTPPGDRATALLGPARAGETDARAGLRDAAARDALVRHIALLDASLAELVR